MLTPRHAFLGLALLAAAPAMAVAQPVPPVGGPAAAGQRGPGALFNRIDANRDDRVSMQEVWVFVQDRFAAADQDRSGGLSPEELQQGMRGMAAGRDAGHQAGRHAEGRPDRHRQGDQGGERAARSAQHLATLFRMLDADRDGQVTLVEIRPMVEIRFRALDANADAAVERGEMPQRQAQHHHRGHGRGGPGGAPAAPANPG